MILNKSRDERIALQRFDSFSCPCCTTPLLSTRSPSFPKNLLMTQASRAYAWAHPCHHSESRPRSFGLPVSCSRTKANLLSGLQRVAVFRRAECRTLLVTPTPGFSRYIGALTKVRSPKLPNGVMRPVKVKTQNMSAVVQPFLKYLPI